MSVLNSISNINEENLKKELLKKEGIILVDFWANWCEPCKTFLKTLEEIQHFFKKEIKIYKVNVEENVDLTNQYGIRGIPTLIIFKNGKNIETKVGTIEKEALIDIIKSYMKN